MADDVKIKINERELQTAIDLIQKKCMRAGPEIVRSVAKEKLYETVKAMPVRTGNMRSSAFKVWRELGFAGKPLTKIKDGKKTLKYRRRSGGNRSVVNDFTSGSSWENRLNSQEQPSFSWSLFCAEWRRRHRRVGAHERIKEILGSGLVPAGAAKAFRDGLKNGSYRAAWSAIIELLNSTEAGRMFLNPGAAGYWRPYMFKIKGKSLRIDEKKVMKKYRDILREYSAQ